MANLDKEEELGMPFMQYSDAQLLGLSQRLKDKDPTSGLALGIRQRKAVENLTAVIKRHSKSTAFLRWAGVILLFVIAAAAIVQLWLEFRPTYR